MYFIRHTFILCFVIGWETSNGIIQTRAKGTNVHPTALLNKVSFTQKGYIQFLKYVVKVPPIKDYTFCIWTKSNNFTYSHPLLSYSKHENERLIRVWISAFGNDLNLAIFEHHLFKIPLHFVEHQWYHICQSWSSHHAAWNLYLNGKLKATGFEIRLKDLRIKGGGDMVVGQEYTDFDKGLDDGIEGDVFGFNFVLSSSIPHRQHFIGDTAAPLRKPKGFLSDMFDFFNFYDHTTHIKRRIMTNVNTRIINEIDAKTVGTKLVESSYNCALGKGAPVKGKEVLISWTKTPVRVFGGAVLKQILPFCTV